MESHKVSNAAIKLKEIAAYLAAELAGLPTGLIVCTSMERNFLGDYGKVYPAVWVRASRWTPNDDGSGYSGITRQHGTYTVSLTIVTQRYNTGNYDHEPDLTALHDRVSAAMIGWQPTKARTPFVLGPWLDGPEAESVGSRDMIFTCSTTYTGP